MFYSKPGSIGSLITEVQQIQDQTDEIIELTENAEVCIFFKKPIQLIFVYACF